MGCKSSKVLDPGPRRQQSPPTSPRSKSSATSVGQNSPVLFPSVLVMQVEPCQRTGNATSPRLARSVSNTTFIIPRESPSSPAQSWASGSMESLSMNINKRQDGVEYLSDEVGEDPVLDGRLTRTIIRHCENYKLMTYVNRDDISDIVEVYNCSDDSDEDDNAKVDDSDPMLARGTRTPEMVRKIRAFEKDVSDLLITQSVPGCSTTDIGVRPKAAKGVRTLCEQDTSADEAYGLPGTVGLVATNQWSRPQLTVAGVKVVGNDCLDSWMKRQKEREESKDRDSG